MERIELDDYYLECKGTERKPFDCPMFKDVYESIHAKWEAITNRND